MKKDTNNYRELLLQIRDLLTSVGDARWGPRLASWIAEIDELSNRDDLPVLDHVRRTRRAVAGMGSTGDVVISAEAGHEVPADEIEISRLNAQLHHLVHSLYLITAKLLDEES
jgi:hypothetical protein